MTEGEAAAEWRLLGDREWGLAGLLSENLSVGRKGLSAALASLRQSDNLLVASDYGGSHSGALYDAVSFLVTTRDAVPAFDSARRSVRSGPLGGQRRMSYKTLGDGVRFHSLPGFLDALNSLPGVLVTFAVDKKAVYRVAEPQGQASIIGDLSVWKSRSFARLTMIAHLAGIVVEGVRSDGQDVLWISDQDEIAPNQEKHAEAARMLGRIISHYCSGPMGRFWFATTQSDLGDLLIEDLAAAPDLAAGCIQEVLAQWHSHPESASVARVFMPPGGDFPGKLHPLASWLGADGALSKLSVVVDEGSVGCSVRRFEIVTDLADL